MAYKKISGVYKITNTITNKIYIGCSVNTTGRFNKHKQDLRKNKHHCTYLQRAWNKYGEENFKFEIIEYINDINTILVREQYYLDTLLFAQEYIRQENDKFTKLGYNMSPTARANIGGSRKGKPMAETTKMKLSIAHRGKKKTLESIEKARIGQINYYLNTPKHLRPPRKLSGKPRAPVTEQARINASNARKGLKKKDKIGTLVQRLKLSRPVIQLDKNGIAVNYWLGSMFAADELGFNKYCIRNAARENGKKIYKNYYWKWAM